MARTAIAVQSIAAYGGELEDITWTAGDAANDHEFVHPGGTVIVLFKNGHTAPIDAVIKGVASPRTFNRATDVTVSTTNAEESAFACPDKGFDQGSGVVHIDLTTDTNFEIAVIKAAETP